MPVCETCGSSKWFYGHQQTVFYEVTRFDQEPTSEPGELTAVIDPTTEEETNCAWRNVECENGHTFDSWDFTTRSEEERS